VTAIQTLSRAETRIEGLDGLRGVSVLLVMLVHTGLVGCGWIGVQIFFVLSGFLITRILLEAKQQGSARRYFGHFYLRRSLRIFPAYYGYLVLVTLGAWLAQPVLADGLSRIAPYLYTYTYNYGLLLAENPPDSKWLVHLWSLQAEEQFYLVWPLLLWLLPQRLLLPVIGAIVLAGPLLRAAVYFWARLLPDASISPVNTVYVFTVSHIDAFAIGAALCLPGVAPLLARFDGKLFSLAVLGVVVSGVVWNAAAGNPAGTKYAPFMLGMPVLLPAKGQWLWGYSAVNVLAAIVLSKVMLQGFGGALFRHPALNALGRVSYGAYLLHFGLTIPFMPLTAQWVASTGLPAWSGTLLWFPLYALVVYGLAGLSFRYFESPILRLKARFRYGGGLTQEGVVPPISQLGVQK
jgi:peptidoglycan/LPS O-acetylase OafA/YrhL